MFDKFQQAKELFNLKKQADMLKKEMERISIKVYEGDYEIIMQGNQTVVDVKEGGESKPVLVTLFNKAVKESQKEVAKKMKGQLSGLGLPGM